MQNISRHGPVVSTSPHNTNSGCGKDISEMHTQSRGRKGWRASVCGCKLMMMLKGAA